MLVCTYSGRCLWEALNDSRVRKTINVPDLNVRFLLCFLHVFIAAVFVGGQNRTDLGLVHEQHQWRSPSSQLRPGYQHGHQRQSTVVCSVAGTDQLAHRVTTSRATTQRRKSRRCLKNMKHAFSVKHGAASVCVSFVVCSRMCVVAVCLRCTYACVCTECYLVNARLRWTR